MTSGSTAEETLDAAFAATPRTQYLPASQHRFAALDLPLPIGEGQTCSQPATVRRMLTLLDVRPGQHVLDVGAGSGWTTALLGRLVGPTGSVVGVELDPTLAAQAAARVTATGMGWVRVEQALAGQLGWPDQAPYDRVLVSAEAADLPGDLLAQMAPDAVLVLPVAGLLTRVALSPGAAREVTTHGHVLFVPLR